MWDRVLHGSYGNYFFCCIVAVCGVLLKSDRFVPSWCSCVWLVEFIDFSLPLPLSVFLNILLRLNHLWFVRVTV